MKKKGVFKACSKWKAKYIRCIYKQSTLKWYLLILDIPYERKEKIYWKKEELLKKFDWIDLKHSCTQLNCDITSSRSFSNWRFTLSACARITGTLMHVAVTLTSLSFYKSRIVKNIEQVDYTKQTCTTVHQRNSNKSPYDYMNKVKQKTRCEKLTQIFLVSFTIFISSSLYPFSRTGALCENKLKAYCKSWKFSKGCLRKHTSFRSCWMQR